MGGGISDEERIGEITGDQIVESEAHGEVETDRGVNMGRDVEVQSRPEIELPAAGERISEMDGERHLPTGQIEVQSEVLQIDSQTA